jgi:ATP-dependent RNA helicase RhlE
MAQIMVKALRKTGLQLRPYMVKISECKTAVLEAFKNKEVGVLVATDIAARGIDIDQLPFVINFDLPNIPKHTFIE